ncbi:MAG TPA: pilin [Candidatus Saccharimonadales bacterium]|nr:pilin [Candidatus Saccharimonadales bacterium]
MSQKLKLTFACLALIVSILAPTLVVSQFKVAAAAAPTCTDPTTHKPVACVTCPDGTTKVANLSQCSAVGSGTNGGNCADISQCDLFKNYLNPFIDFLAALVGVAVVISIVYGGIQYGSSGGDPQKVTAAKNRIRNALIALVTFIFLFSLLKFLVPGGNLF